MTQRAGLTFAEKALIRERKQAGATHVQVAGELGCSVETVRKWWRSFRQGKPPRARGRPALGVLSSYPDAVREQCLALKRQHPHWGPANVKLELKQQLGLQVEQLPSDSRLSALFKAACPEAVQTRCRHHYRERAPTGVRRVHQRWQIDGKEMVPIGEGEVATILTVREPVAGLMLAAKAFQTTTKLAWRKLTLGETQAVLRSAFTQWGLPSEVQTDHEQVYTGSTTADFPTWFSLWLVGLGLKHVTSRSRQPTDQPHVERSHRTLGDMAWKDEHFADLPALQQALDKMCLRYNCELPVQAADCAGRPPLLAHPDACHSGRPYSQAIEWSLFDMQRVDAYLAKCHWLRHVDANGCVNVGDHSYSVGRRYKGQTVSVSYVPELRAFHLLLADGTNLATRHALGLEQSDIIGFVPLNTQLDLPIQLPLFTQEGTIL